jgi:hypothetical protein
LQIISDNGSEMVNSDQVFAFSLGQASPNPSLPPADVLVAQGGNWTAPIVVGLKERCERALVEIRRGLEQHRKTLDLRDVEGVGQRPNPDIVIPRMAEDAVRKILGNGGQ